jgi:homocysteine S-methyltransferase
MSSFLARLQARPLLADGAMGTMLYARGIGLHLCLEALVVERPALVAAIHEEYGRAGADVLSSHTCGAKRMRLAYYGVVEKVREFNLAAVRLALGVR